MAPPRQENIGDQLALLTDEAAVPTVDDLSLRLLRHQTSAIRHRKFHGVDIVMVQVEGSDVCPSPSRFARRVPLC